MEITSNTSNGYEKKLKCNLSQSSVILMIKTWGFQCIVTLIYKKQALTIKKKLHFLQDGFDITNLLNKYKFLEKYSGTKAKEYVYFKQTYITI